MELFTVMGWESGGATQTEELVWLTIIFLWIDIGHFNSNFVMKNYEIS